jgi:hypothetical protein
VLKEHCSEMIINKTIEEEIRWSLIKQTARFTHSPHPGLHCFHTLHLSVCTKLREGWPETRSYLMHLLSVLKAQSEFHWKPGVAVGPMAERAL